MSVEVFPVADLEVVNDYLADKTPEQIVEWTVNTFDPYRIYSLTSAGLSAPLTLDLLDRTARAGTSPQIPIIHNDTGLLPDEVLKYLYEDLSGAFEFEPISCEGGLTPEEVRRVEADELWKHDISKYRKITKLDPIGNTIRKLGAQVIITGVRQDQTSNRLSSLDVVTYGADGEIRVNPNFLTPKSEVEEHLDQMIDRNRVARHPLYLVVDFVDDWPFLGGPKVECGINSFSRLNAEPILLGDKSA